ncbi:protein TsetseEP-like [Chanodichthys erythropterus]|uniref:protein TsetseEP-like n=1 Tax=Chanodichthys erythropterus TaxID=933992 RepID=UPI00351F21B2
MSQFYFSARKIRPLESEDNLKIVATMRKAYNFVLIKEGNSTTTLPEPQHQAQTEPQPQAQLEPQHQAQPEPQHQAQTEPQPQAQTEPQPQAQTEPQPQAQLEPQHQAQPEPQHQAQTEPQPQAQPEPQHQFLALAESQPRAQEKETFYLLDLYPVSLPVKEQPPLKKESVAGNVVGKKFSNMTP